MNDVRFFLKAIEFLFAFLFLWFLSTVITRQIWLFPLVFVGLCVYQVVQCIRQIRKRQRYEQARAVAEEAVKRAEEARATANRLAEEARIAADQYAIAYQHQKREPAVLTDEAIAMFTNPN
jgi:hypothetical protein